MTEPITYTHVVDKNGKVILENKPEKTQVVSPETAYIMYDLLKGPVERYSSRPAKFGDIPVVGKTGTTENIKDLWFAGTTPYMAAAIWIGADKPTELTDKYGKKPFSGSTASALFGKIMEKAHESLPPVEIPRPENIVSANICSVSGLLTTQYCASDPRGSKVYTELFIKGTVPTHTCDVHVPVTINSLTGAIATANTPEYLKETRVFLNRKYTPSVYLSDQKYVAPKVYDNGSYELPDNDDNLNQDGVDPDEEWFEDENNTPTTPDDSNTSNPDNSDASDNNTIPPIDNKPPINDTETDIDDPPLIEDIPILPDFENSNNGSSTITPSPPGDGNGSGSNNSTEVPPNNDNNNENTDNTNNGNGNTNNNETTIQPPSTPDNNDTSNGTEIDNVENESLDSADFDFG